MTEEMFRQLAETYGADIDRWPAARRVEARAVAVEPWAMAALDAAADLDDLFSALPGTVPPHRVGRVIGRVTAELRADRRGMWGLVRRMALPWAGLATAGVMGVAVAVAMTTPPAVDPDRGAAQLLAMTMSYSDPAWFADLGG